MSELSEAIMAVVRAEVVAPLHQQIAALTAERDAARKERDEALFLEAAHVRSGRRELIVYRSPSGAHYMAMDTGPAGNLEVQEGELSAEPEHAARTARWLIDGATEVRPSKAEAEIARLRERIEYVRQTIIAAGFDEAAPVEALARYIVETLAQKAASNDHARQQWCKATEEIALLRALVEPTWRDGFRQGVTDKDPAVEDIAWNNSDAKRAVGENT